MQRLERDGLEVREIQDRWVGALGSRDSDNLNAFVQNCETMSEEDAAKMTWTGRQVAEFGFTQVRVLSPLAELPGIGLDVQVLFTKPSGA